VDDEEAMARQPKSKSERKSKPKKRKGEVPVREAAETKEDISGEAPRGSEPERDIEKETPGRGSEYRDDLSPND
jgi:hypothetical protein